MWSRKVEGPHVVDRRRAEAWKIRNGPIRSVSYIGRHGALGAWPNSAIAFCFNISAADHHLHNPNDSRLDLASVSAANAQAFDRGPEPISSALPPLQT